MEFSITIFISTVILITPIVKMVSMETKKNGCLPVSICLIIQNYFISRAKFINASMNGTVIIKQGNWR